MSRDRRGVAVVMVLLLVLGGTALAHGALLVARGELFAARARASALERTSVEQRQENKPERKNSQTPVEIGRRAAPIVK